MHIAKLVGISDKSFDTINYGKEITSDDYIYVNDIYGHIDEKNKIFSTGFESIKIPLMNKDKDGHIINWQDTPFLIETYKEETKEISVLEEYCKPLMSDETFDNCNINLVFAKQLYSEIKELEKEGYKELKEELKDKKQPRIKISIEEYI